MFRQESACGGLTAQAVRREKSAGVGANLWHFLGSRFRGNDRMGAGMTLWGTDLSYRFNGLGADVDSPRRAAHILGLFQQGLWMGFGGYPVVLKPFATGFVN